MRFFAFALTMLIIMLYQPVKAEEQTIMNDVLWSEAHAEIDSVMQNLSWRDGCPDNVISPELEIYFEERYSVQLQQKICFGKSNTLNWFKALNTRLQYHIAYKALWSFNMEGAHQFKNPIAASCARKPANLNMLIDYVMNLDKGAESSEFYVAIRRFLTKSLHACVRNQREALNNMISNSGNHPTPSPDGKE